MSKSAELHLRTENLPRKVEDHKKILIIVGVGLQIFRAHRIDESGQGQLIYLVS